MTFILNSEYFSSVHSDFFLIRVAQDFFFASPKEKYKQQQQIYPLKLIENYRSFNPCYMLSWLIIFMTRGLLPLTDLLNILGLKSWNK
jgi:hypothetical protein